MAIPTTNADLSDGQTFESRYQSDSGLVKVQGLSGGSVSVELEISGEGFAPIDGARNIVNDGAYPIRPFPEGTIRASSPEGVTVIVQRSS